MNESLSNILLYRSKTVVFHVLAVPELLNARRVVT